MTATSTPKSSQPSSLPWWALLLLAVGAVAIGTQVQPSPTPATTTTVAASSSTTSKPTTTTTAAPTSTYVRPFGDAAVWNRPVSEFGVHPRSAEFAARCYWWCNLGGAGRLSLYFDDYSQPVYDARQATTTIKVYKANFGFPGSIRNGATIPWSPTWRPGGGNDAIMVIIDPSTGREIDLWTAYLPGDTRQSTCLTPDNLAVGFGRDAGLCVGGADVIQGADGKPIDYRTATSTYPMGGAYFESLAMSVSADEVRSGAIRHALNAVVYNTMFGPQCTPAEMGTTAFGSTCGGWLPPASRLEWGPTAQPCAERTQTYDVAGRSQTVPEGARFFITSTDAEIGRWLDSRGFTGRLRETARVFAVAARDYGFIITNTSCFDAGIITTGRVGPDAAGWNALGVPADKKAAMRLLDGLVTPTNLRMAGPSAPPVVGSNRAAA